MFIRSPYFNTLHKQGYTSKADLPEVIKYIVVCLPHVGAVEAQKPRNTHPTINVRVFTARCWVMHATMNALLSVATVAML
jgi:hypothetical protein